MLKIFFNILNCCRPRKSVLNGKAEEIFNNIHPVYQDAGDLSEWIVTERLNWGSARPDNMGVLVTDMVTAKDGNLIFSAYSFPDGIQGKDYDGNLVEPRYYIGSQAYSRYRVNFGQSVSFLCTIEPAVGCCPAVWTFPMLRSEEEMKFYDKYYREIDLLESYPDNESALHHILQTIHFGGRVKKRKMVNRTIKKQAYFSDKILFTVELHRKKIVLKVNGVITAKYLLCRQEWKGLNLVLGYSATEKRKPYFNIDQLEKKRLGRLIVHGIKIANL